MGLRKTKQINSAVSADYWKLAGFNFDERTLSISVYLELFTDEQSSLSGDVQLFSERFIIKNISKDDSFSLGYIYSKLEDEYGFEPWQTNN